LFAAALRATGRDFMMIINDELQLAGVLLELQGVAR